MFGAVENQDFDNLPQISSIESNAQWSTAKIAVDGDFLAQFSQQEVKIYEDIVEISIPDLVEFNGQYQSYFEGAESKLIGGIILDLDYSNFDMTQDDLNTESNYLAAKVNLNGSLESVGFDDVNLDISVNRTGYEEVESNFRYEFGANRFIDGSAIITGDEFELNASNELGLKIVIKDQSEDNYTVGEITSNNGSELYAYIRDDGEPYFEFRDGSIEYLLPEID